MRSNRLFKTQKEMSTPITIGGAWCRSSMIRLASGPRSAIHLWLQRFVLLSTSDSRNRPTRSGLTFFSLEPCSSRGTSAPRVEVCAEPLG